MISAHTKICMVIGDPVEHSLSPLLHNAGYQAIGIDNTYVYVGCKVSPSSIKEFAEGARAMGIRGISCTMPHKEIIMPFLDEIDSTATAIGAVNTIVQEDGKLIGRNTDWIGTVAPLLAITPLKGKSVAIIGAGGAAKAMAYGLTREGADVTIFARSQDKAAILAKQFGCTARALSEQAEIEDMDIICNATPVGMGEHASLSPIDAGHITDRHVVLDAVYHPYDTQLLKDAAKHGARTIHGTEMLLHQAMAQFSLYTCYKAPEAAMRQALHDALGQQKAAK